MSVTKRTPKPVEWGDWQPWDPGIIGPRQYGEVPRKDAVAHFEALLAGKAKSNEAICSLLRRNGVEPGCSDEAIGRIDDWFRESVEPHPEHPERLKHVWFAVARDLSLFLGDCLIKRNPQLRWELFVWGKSDVSYHKPVLMGFDVKEPRYHAEFDRILAMNGHIAIAGEDFGPRPILHNFLAEEELA